MAGVLSMLLFAIPLAVGAVITYAYWEINNISTFDRNYDIDWWKLRAFPAVVLIPLMLFFSGFTNYSLATDRRLGLPITLVTTTLFSFPLIGILGAMGMAHPRYRSIQHPPMYLSEIIAIIISLVLVSAGIIAVRNGKNTNSQTKNAG